MRAFPMRPWIVLAVCALGGVMLWQVAAWYAPVSLGVRGAPPATVPGKKKVTPETRLRGLLLVKLERRTMTISRASCGS